MLPIVATLLNAGLGILGNAVATKGKDFIEEKIGVDITKLMGSEEGKIKLAQLEMHHEETLQKYAIERRSQELEEVKLEHSNTANARDMQKAALAQDDKFSKRFVYYLAGGWSLFSIVYITVITLVTIPPTNVRFVDTILGFLLGSIVATIINYFFGSSKGSRDKDASLANAIKGQQNV
jgi:hypothetical protein